MGAQYSALGLNRLSALILILTIRIYSRTGGDMKGLNRLSALILILTIRKSVEIGRSGKLSQSPFGSYFNPYINFGGFMKLKIEESQSPFGSYFNPYEL